METNKEVEVSYQQITNFRVNARNYLGGDMSPDRSKLDHALKKMLKATEEHYLNFADFEADLKIELASSDKDGNLIQDKETGYAFTKPNAKDLQKRLREQGAKKVKITPYIATELPKKLSQVWYEFFVPFVIEDKEPE